MFYTPELKYLQSISPRLLDLVNLLFLIATIESGSITLKNSGGGGGGGGGTTLELLQYFHKNDIT